MILRFFIILTVGIFTLIGGGFSAQAGVLNVQDITSKNGVKAWLSEDHTVPVIAVQFSFLGAGAVNDGADKQGLSQMLSNTLDEGAGAYSAQQFQKALNDHSISLRFSSSRDHFGGGLKTLSKYKATAFELLRAALTIPHFDEDALRRMRDANLARIRSNMTDPEWMAARLTNSVIFAGHPYARNSGGTLSALPRITADDLRAKVRTQLGRDRLVVSVAGDITADELSQILDDVFGALPPTSHVVDVPAITIADAHEMVLLRKDIPQSVVSMVMPGMSVHDPDYAAAEVMNYILGGAGFGSRLMDVVREQKGLAYGIYSDLNELRHATQFSVQTSTKNESVSDVLSLVHATMKGMMVQPVSKGDVTDAVSYLVGSVPLGLTSTDRIAATLTNLQEMGLSPRYFDERAAALKRVTPDDVMRVSLRLLRPDTVQIILVGNPKISHTVKDVKILPDVD